MTRAFLLTSCRLKITILILRKILRRMFLMKVLMKMTFPIKSHILSEKTKPPGGINIVLLEQPRL
ncbi:unnamed protein product [Callosobruchus maculatus]|uniref:Uncharacterized protein n=1 Tax=Callosobruchus maculatus TaxID=64391 RepID=A0A653BMX4_CALMS|nr:unnamed protein product [Callosobruchus maculatus]